PPSEPSQGKKGSLDLSVKLVKITGGRFTVAHLGRRGTPLVLDDVNLEVRDFSPGSESPFTFTANVSGGGSVDLNGKAGPLNSTHAAASLLTATLKSRQLELVRSGIAQSAPALGGLISVDGSANSDGKTARIEGKIKAEKLKLARTATPAKRDVLFDFAVR